MSNKHKCKMELMKGGGTEADCYNRLCALELLAHGIIRPDSGESALKAAEKHYLKRCGGLCDDCQLYDTCIVVKFES